MSFCCTTKGAIIRIVLRFNPNPKPIMTWYPYWAFGMLKSVLSMLLNRPTPMVCRDAPISSRYSGGTRNFETKNPAAVLATGESNKRGRSRIPAPIAEVALTVCNRWGMLMIAAVKGNPVKNPLLCRLLASNVDEDCQSGQLTAVIPTRTYFAPTSMGRLVHLWCYLRKDVFPTQ